MIGKPKYKTDQEVTFTIDNKSYTGKVCIVDANGTFFDKSDVSYDIKVDNYDGSGRACLFKHINEKSINE